MGLQDNNMQCTSDAKVLGRSSARGTIKGACKITICSAHGMQRYWQVLSPMHYQMGLQNNYAVHTGCEGIGQVFSPMHNQMGLQDNNMQVLGYTG